MSPLAVLPDGSFVPDGRVIRTLEDPFLPGGALPSWLSAQAGTLSWSGPNAAAGGYGQMNTGATVNNVARLATTFDTYLNAVRELSFTVEGLQFLSDASPNMGYSFAMGFAPLTKGAGAALAQTATSTTAYGTQYGGANGSASMNYFVLAPNGGSRKAKNLTVRLRVPTRELFILEDDQVFESVTLPALVNSAACRAFIEVTSTGGADQGFKFKKVRYSQIEN